MLFLFLKHHCVPNKLWIFVGHGNVKDHLSVKRIGLWLPTIFTKPAEAKFSFALCCEDFNLPVLDNGFCSTCMPTASVVGGGWLEVGQLVEQETCVLDSPLILAGLCDMCNGTINVPLFFPNAVWTAWGRKISLNWVWWWWQCLMKLNSFSLFQKELPAQSKRQFPMYCFFFLLVVVVWVF